METSLYIHIPFCESTCAYCAFSSFVADAAEKERYLKALCEEIKRRKTDKAVRSIYFGGGTPSALTDEQIGTILGCIFENFNIESGAEITIEANPNSVTKKRLEFWKKLGFTRVSLGVQTLSEVNLKKIGRLHTRNKALDAIKSASEIFGNVSCDLLVGLEGETGEILCQYARELLMAGAVHISCYLLEIYESTRLAKMIKNGEFSPLSDDKMIDAFEALSAFLCGQGLERYEISNFACDGYESRHNLNYWARGEYLGFGLSAHSFVENVRTENANTFENYYKNITKSEALSQQERNEEKIMLGLRCRLGVDANDLEGYDITKNPNFSDYLSRGILTQKGSRIFLNPKFYDVSNTIISNLFEK